MFQPLLPLGWLALNLVEFPTDRHVGL